jgi:HEAT repeat protein
MLMPTMEQRVRIMLHHAWALRDAGWDNKAIIEKLSSEGVPSHIANEVPKLIDDATLKLIHDAAARQTVVEQVTAAIEAEDYEALQEAMLQGVDDERTLHKMYCELEKQLLSDSHPQGTIAAFGLSFLLGLGDWPLIQALSHPDWNVRFRAAFALGKMGKHAHNALAPLRELTHDSDDFVQEAAKEAVDAIEKAMKPWWKFW